MPAAIEVHGLVKGYYGPLPAVDGIDFSVPAGAVFAFLGPNGAGKTTTTEILEGLRRRTDGEVRVLGLDPGRKGAPLHRRIGVIPQDFRFFEKITPGRRSSTTARCSARRRPRTRCSSRSSSLDKATRASTRSPAARSRSSGSPSR